MAKGRHDSQAGASRRMSRTRQPGGTVTQAGFYPSSISFFVFVIRAHGTERKENNKSAVLRVKFRLVDHPAQLSSAGMIIMPALRARTWLPNPAYNVDVPARSAGMIVMPALRVG